MEGFQVTDFKTAVSKIRAAVAAKETPDFVIIARTDCRPLLGLEQAIERAHAFADAGADVVYVELLGSRQEVEYVARAVTEVPLLFDMFDHPKVPVLSALELEQMGYKIVTYPFTATLAYAELLNQLYPSIRRAKGIAQLAVERMELHAFEKILRLDTIWQDILQLQPAPTETPSKA
jgi:2-methylisocitrate lyase-like PEP mutase family enzyme